MTSSIHIDLPPELGSGKDDDEEMLWAGQKSALENYFLRSGRTLLAIANFLNPLLGRKK